MGYEGHLMVLDDRDRQRAEVAAAMAGCVAAHADVGGDDRLGRRHGHLRPPRHTGVTEIQAGSYALMDTAYATLGLPFEQALFVVGTVISVRPATPSPTSGSRRSAWTTATRRSTARRCGSAATSTSRSPPGDGRPAVGDRVRVVPAHVDPTMAMHEVAWLVRRRRGPRPLGRSTCAAGDDRGGASALAWLAVGADAPRSPSQPVDRPASDGAWLTVVRSLMPWAALSAAARSPSRAAATGRRRLAVGRRRRRRRRRGDGRAARRAAGRQPPVDPAARPLSIVHANLLYVNRRVADVAGGARHARRRRRHVQRAHAGPRRDACDVTELAAGYPYRIELPRRARQRHRRCGAATPSTERPTTRTTHHTVVADVARPGRHRARHRHPHPEPDRPPRPVGRPTSSGSARWSPTGPAVMTGDFNAGWWHPEFRRLLRRGGWRDAHISVGRGLSCSWPTEQWHAGVPLAPAVRPPRPRARQRRRSPCSTSSTSTSPAATTGG